MIKITDLVDSRDLVELHESEMESIYGGNCEYGGGDYSPGSRITLGNDVYECKDRFLRSDKWEFVYSI